MERLLTIFTPTYNRKNCIEHCYRSLQRQSSFNFEWLIIDDGSTDNTEMLIREWQREERRFPIRYVYKQNGGLHTGYNLGIQEANTELFMCIDSDDWLPDDAVERIEKIWSSISSDSYVGIMGMDYYENGKPVGGFFPESIHEMYLYEKLTKYRITGDKKMIHKTELLKKVAPMPVFPGEKDFNPSYLMYQLDQFGKLYVTNDCFCIVDYQPDGMSSNMYKQYRFSPLSYLETRKLYLSFPEQSFAFRFKQYIHYTSSCLLAKCVSKGMKEAPDKALAVLAFPPGVLLTCLVLWKTRKFQKGYRYEKSSVCNP